jgi:sugar lactone lactonase YvrE
MGERGYAGDGKPAREAKFNWPMEIALGPALDFYVADYENCRIRRIDGAPGIVSTVAGTGQCDTSGDGGKASAAAINHPTAVAVDGAGNIYFNDQPPACVRRIDVSTLLINSIPNTCDIKPGKSEAPSGLAVDHQGNLYIAYFSSNVVRRVDAKTGVSKIVAGNGLPARIVRKVYSFPLQRRPWPVLPASCPNEQLPKKPGEKPPSCE